MALKNTLSIAVPEPKGPTRYETEFFGERFEFGDLKQLLGAADFSKAGDRNAGLAPKNEKVREAARSLLSGLTLQHLYDNPPLDEKGQIDSVMRVGYDIDLAEFKKLSTLTLGGLKNLLLEKNGAEIRPIGRALTSIMAAAMAKLMDTHELIYIASKIENPSKARTTLGLSGRLSSRLQPNHPSDDLRGVTLLSYAGLSLASGDALMGVNPAIDTVDSVSAVLERLNAIRTKTKAPTQICVLAHIKTQLACLRTGVPVEILFQSLAGTERTLGEEFDVTVELLDDGYHEMKTNSPLKDIGKNLMYFETGQGSEFTYGKHNGMDMTTTEALCYGLARRYEPFMVNNVTGFIGPETHKDNFEMLVANLQDHFMGKLLGLPMGMAPCYTMHSGITLEGQQMATQLLTAAGANYYMDVFLNTDRMLAYFDTSAHDNQTLREVHHKRPTPEFEEWALKRGILKESGGNLTRGERWGKLEDFGASTEELG